MKARINRFFRSPQSLESLRTKVFSSLEGSGPHRIRIWCPGCSSGEELYSIAILLLEYLGPGDWAGRVQLFGTDISQEAIDVARIGVYPESIRTDVSRERLNRFFVKTRGGYRIKESVRNLCLFAVHDLTKQPPLWNMDLICCRCVLADMNAALQDTILSLFHFVLRVDGFLFLGSSKSTPVNTDLFKVLDRKHQACRHQHASAQWD